ncbi:MAG: hypothetical protein AAGC67_02690 [Myxococcota bacterium]
MSAATGREAPDRLASARVTLSRALACESRNALARVELAASELERSGLSPALAARVDTIRAAVTEIDGLLGKIDFVSDAARVPDRATADLVAAARSVVARLAPSLGARDIQIAWVGEETVERAFEVAAPGPALEGLVLALVRLVVGAIDRRTPSGGRAARIDLDAVRHGDDLGLFVRSDAIGASSRFDRTARLELEVALVDWQGAFVVTEQGAQVEVGFRVPAHDPSVRPRVDAGIGSA